MTVEQYVTGGSFTPINGYLRNLTPAQMQAQADEAGMSDALDLSVLGDPESEGWVRQEIDGLDAAIAKSRTTAPARVYRSFDDSQISGLGPGDSFVDAGYGSTTTDLDLADAWGGNATMSIEVPEGAEALWVDGLPDISLDQKELLLARGGRYEIDSVETLPDGRKQYNVRLVGQRDPEAPAPGFGADAALAPKPKVSPQQAQYLGKFVDGPGYVRPYGVNGNTVLAAQKLGYIELVEGSTTHVRLTPAGREALGLDPNGAADDTTLPGGTGPDLAGPSDIGDPTPDLPGPTVTEGEVGEALPGHVAPFVGPGDKVYRHPQGSYIVAGPDGSVVKIGPDGKPRKTSATAAKLAVGHGSWEPVAASKPAPVKKPTEPPVEVEPLTDLAPEAAVVVSAAEEPELPSAPAPKTASKFQVPMTFNEAPVTDVPKYIEDPNFFFQQKIDGIRGQLVIEPGKKPWFRSKSGQQLQSSTAAKITGPMLAKLGAQSDYDGPAYTIDGELLDGKWYVFDVAVDGGEKLPWEQRMKTAEAWVGEMHKLGLKQIQALPTARTPEEKRKLWDAVNASGGEGVMMKRRDAPYNYGARVNHTLKAKITSTADVVVMARNLEGKENAQIGIHINGQLVPIGTVSMQGKEKGGAVNVGDVIEVEYLWANPANRNLQQPRMKKRRPDKAPAEATADQLRFVGKDVVDLEAPGQL